MDISTMDQKPICISGLAMRWWNVKFQVSINTAAWLRGWVGGMGGGGVVGWVGWWGLLQRRGGVGGKQSIKKFIYDVGCLVSVFFCL